MIKAAMRHGVGLAVIVIIIAIFGVLSLFRVPVQMTPDLTPQSVTVQTIWPGATPQDIEKEILVDQEKYLRSLPNLDKMISTASTGRAEIILEFRTGTALDEVLVRVNNALAQVPSYPENVDQPRIVTSSASEQPIAWFSVRALPGNPKNVDIAAMQDFLEDTVQTEFERTPGVAESGIFGGTARQVRLYLDPAQMAERGITFNDIRAALRSRNRDISGGDFSEGKRRYLVRTVGRFRDVGEIQNLVVAMRDNTPVYLRDIGYAVFSAEEKRSQVRHNGEPAIAMNVRRQPGTNIMEVMQEVRSTVTRLNETVLADAGLILRQVSDDTIYIGEAVTLVRNNLILGGILATMVMLLFLRSGPATLIGALGIPICTVAAFLGLTLAGRTINVISLAGVAFAVGMTVDNSIVVLENIFRHKSMGKRAWDAALDGVNEVWGAVLASTLTTVFVFLPIVFIQEEAGQLFADIAIAITFAILCSLLVAITVIPSATARLFHRVGEQRTSRFGRAFQEAFGLAPIARKFRDAVMVAVVWLMRGVIRRVALVIVMAGIALGFVKILMPATEYLPDGNMNLMFAIMLPPPGYNIEELTDIGRQIEAIYLPHVMADRDAYANGETAIPPIRDFFFVSTTQNIFVVTRTVEDEDLDALMPVLMADLNEVPGMIGFAVRRSIFARGLSGTRGIDLDVTGSDLSEIYDAALQTFITMNQRIGGRVRPDPGLVLGQPLIEIVPDWDRAAELGVNTQDLGFLVWAFTDGAYLDEYFIEDDKVDLYVYSTQGTVERTQDLDSLLLYTSSGGTVPLSSVATVRETVNTETIRRVDRRRAVTIQVVPPNELALETAVAMIENEIIPDMRASGQLPAGVSVRVAGASDKLRATRDAVSGNLVLAIVIAYLLMVALFAHWGYPLVIMTSLPLGFSGGLVGLWMMNNAGQYLGWMGVPTIQQPLDVITMLGFVILVGVVVNNPILLVEQTLINIRQGGMNVIDAVIDSTRTRIRPIMMSMTTTTFGLLPLVVRPGAGNELYRGLGTIMLFGIFFSAVFTLTFIPSLFSLFLQAGEKLGFKAVRPLEHEPYESPGAPDAPHLARTALDK